MFLRIYTFLCVSIISSLLLFVALNVLIAPLDSPREASEGNCIFDRYGAEAVRASYPNISQASLDALLNEFCRLGPLHYEPFSESREREFRGKYINVDAAGFRYVLNQCSWPPSEKTTNTYLFGGSTTFGYGVSDHESIASYLQEYLSHTEPKSNCVYNFGKGYYYSTLERIYFQQLLLQHKRPERVVFIDGLNEFYFLNDVGPFTSQLRKFSNGEIYEEYSREHFALSARNHFPIVSLGQRWLGLTHPSVAVNEPEIAPTEQAIHYAAQRYITNMQMMRSTAHQFNIRPLFVVQPIPAYHYDFSENPFLRKHPQQALGRHWNSRRGYEVLRDKIDNSMLLLWLADMHSEVNEPRYVDSVHYSSTMNQAIAKQIAVALKAN